MLSLHHRFPVQVCRGLHGGFAMALILGMAGCQTTPERDFDPVVAQFYIETPPQAGGAQSLQLPRSGVQVAVSPRAVLTEMDVHDVELVRVDLGLCLMFEFLGDGAQALTRVSGANLGRRLVVTLNGRPFGARMIDGPILNGQLLMFIELPDDELTTTAVNLKRTANEIQTALAAGRRKVK